MARTPPGYYLHLVAWAQIGVLVRIYFAELFGAACPSVHWAPCLTSNGSRWGGAYFTDLPINMFGSFLMGLFVSSDVLSNSLKHTLTVEAPMAMLSTRSPLQEHVAFQVGLRTGLCGSLTTFASWITQMVIMMVGGVPAAMGHSQWVEALGGLLVGTFAASAALVMGQHVALLLYHWLNPGAFIPYGSPAPEQAKLENLGTVEEQPQKLDERSLSTTGLGGSRRLRSISSTRQGSTTIVVVQECCDEPSVAPAAAGAAGATGVSSSPPSAGAAAAADLQSLTTFKQQPPATADGAGGGSVELATVRQHSNNTAAATAATAVAVGQPVSGSSSTVPSPFTAMAGQRINSRTLSQDNVQQTAASLGSAGTVGAAVAAAPLLYEEVDEEEAPAVSAAQIMVDGFACLSIAVLSGISLWRIIQGSSGQRHLVNRDAPFSQEWFWWAILFGPIGCYIRYYLSRYNGTLAGNWKWFPLGTFAANIMACVIDYVMKVLPVRLPMDSVSVAVLAGVVGGVGGCLSTVSTWVVEIQRLLLSFPKTSHGYQYIFISVVTAVVLGLIIYGIPVWTLVL